MASSFQKILRAFQRLALVWADQLKDISEGILPVVEPIPLVVDVRGPRRLAGLPAAPDGSPHAGSAGQTIDLVASPEKQKQTIELSKGRAEVGQTEAATEKARADALQAVEEARAPCEPHPRSPRCSA